MDYISLREKIAIQIASASYDYNGDGIIVGGQTTSREEFWSYQGDKFKETKLMEAQAALDVMASIGYDVVIETAFMNYVDEK